MHVITHLVRTYYTLYSLWGPNAHTYQGLHNIPQEDQSHKQRNTLNEDAQDCSNLTSKVCTYKALKKKLFTHATLKRDLNLGHIKCLMYPFSSKHFDTELE